MEDEIIDVDAPKEEPVTVNLDEGEKPVVVEKKAEEPDEREKALQELRQQLDEQKANVERERQAREQIEQFARQQAAKAQTAEVEIEDSRLSTINNAIDAVEQSALAAERLYADAMTGGDYAAAAKAQRSIAQAEGQLLQLNNGKRALEDRLQSRQTEGRVQPPELPQRQVDPLEAMAARLTPKSAAWLRAHPEAAAQVNKLTAAHSAATQLEGIEVETPEYFSYIEQRLGIGKVDPPTKPAKAAIPSLPAGRQAGGGSGSGDRGNSMTLSPSEVEMAILNEPSLPREKALEIYARNKRALQAEGKLK